MKAQTSFTIPKLILTIMSTCLFAFGQEATKAILVDEWGPENCEIVMARYDAFFAELQRRPDSTGLVVVYGEQGDVAGSVLYENLIKTYPVFRKYPLDRLEFVRGALLAERKTDFWLIPAGADRPSVDRGEWSLRIEPQTKPFLVASESDFDPICPPIGNLKLLNDLLEANPGSRANIVIRGSRTYIRRERNKIISGLTKDRHIAARRIRVFTILGKSPDYLSARVEYWFLP